MIVEIDQTNTLDMSIEVSPAEVDAAADLTLRAKVSCSPACDLRGKTLSIRDQDGALVSRIELTEFDGETNETNKFMVKAPDKAGAYTWLAEGPASADEGLSDMETSAPLSFQVKPHMTNIVVWEVPSAILAGEKFSIKIGIRCSSGCQPTGREMGIYDHEGTSVAKLALRSDVWPGTAALYFAEVELQAPDIQGLFKWEAKVPASDSELPHGEASLAFGVTFVKPPDFRVIVEAVDRETQAPLRGARVRMHPYRAVTDARGVAQLNVPKGAYKIFVSAPKYISVRTNSEVTENMTTKAGLTLEPVREKN
jgi:hypothetical protein